MITFFTFLGKITYIFLSLNQVTAIHFENDIDRYIYGGRSDDINMEVLADNKTLILKPKIKDIKANLLVFTKSANFNFHFKMAQSNPHELVTIMPAKKDSSYKLIKSESTFDLLEGDHSLLFKNKTKIPIKVNDSDIATFDYLSKGPPLFINQRQIYP
jgi:hypothetical protein